MAGEKPAPASGPSPASPATRMQGVSGVRRYNYRAVAAVGFIFGAIDILIAARFLGKIFGAREDLALVQVTYQVSALMAAPFWGMFGKPGPHIDADPALLGALVVYGLIGLGLAGLIRIVTARRGN